MRRYWWLSGHYLVLTGFDREAGIVYYADPNGAETGSVDYESFICDKWYYSPSNPAEYNVARWDGEWMGFYSQK